MAGRVWGRRGARLRPARLTRHSQTMQDAGPPAGLEESESPGFGLERQADLTIVVLRVTAE